MWKVQHIWVNSQKTLRWSGKGSRPAPFMASLGACSRNKWKEEEKPCHQESKRVRDHRRAGPWCAKSSPRNYLPKALLLGAVATETIWTTKEKPARGSCIIGRGFWEKPHDKTSRWSQMWILRCQTSNHSSSGYVLPIQKYFWVDLWETLWSLSQMTYYMTIRQSSTLSS